MAVVGTLAFGQKILGDRDKLLPECFAPVERFIGMHSMSFLSIPINEPPL
jgi:hypothetical protein